MCLPGTLQPMLWSVVFQSPYFEQIGNRCRLESILCKACHVKPQLTSPSRILQLMWIQPCSVDPSLTRKRERTHMYGSWMGVFGHHGKCSLPSMCHHISETSPRARALQFAGLMPIVGFPKGQRYHVHSIIKLFFL